MYSKDVVDRIMAAEGAAKATLENAKASAETIVAKARGKAELEAKATLEGKAAELEIKRNESFSSAERAAFDELEAYKATLDAMTTDEASLSRLIHALLLGDGDDGRP